VTAVRFLLDEHVERAVAVPLRSSGVEAATVPELGRGGQPDEMQMRWAAAEGWVIVTGDRDFLRLANADASHAGIVFYIRRHASIGLLVRGLLDLDRTESAESMGGRVN
jgi:predicted nuclease of predicted toxin-antitoxin system